MSKGYYWKLKVKGGPGSGHWGHAGRPGQVGGSAPSRNAETRFSKAAHEDNIKGTKELGGGVTDSYLVEFENGQRGVWKRDEPVNRAAAEVMVDELDDLFGFGIVPKTVLMTMQAGYYSRGSCQRFVEGARTAGELLDAEGEPYYNQIIQANRERMEGMIFLDYVTGNRDRHFDNFIFDAQDRLWAVDHGQAKDWSGKGSSWAYAHDLGARKGIFALSPRVLAKVRGITYEQYNAMIGRWTDSDFELPIGFDEAWEKIAEVQRTGELKWQ